MSTSYISSEGDTLFTRSSRFIQMEVTREEWDTRFQFVPVGDEMGGTWLSARAALAALPDLPIRWDNPVRRRSMISELRDSRFADHPVLGGMVSAAIETHEERANQISRLRIVK